MVAVKVDMTVSGRAVMILLCFGSIQYLQLTVRYKMILFDSMHVMTEDSIIFQPGPAYSQLG